MAEEFTVTGTSNGFASVHPDLELEQTPTTRLIFRTQIHSGGVRGFLIRQKKGRSDEWQDTGTIDFRRLQSGEGANIELSTESLNQLVQRFNRLSAHIGQNPIARGRQEYVSGTREEVIVTDSNKIKYIQELSEKDYGKDFWEQLISSNPDLATKLSWSKIHADRSQALEDFKENIDDLSRDEAWWQQFFEKNKWIFGYGLNYQILKPIVIQPNYGGQAVTGRGGQRGDYLESSQGEAKFTVLVEIKKPSTPLLRREHRNGAWSPHEELSGGIAQLQTNCRTWEIEGSRTDANKDLVEADGGTFTVEPKGILLIGRSSTLTDRNKKASFQSLRRNLHNPEIITFDELLARAEFIVDNESIKV